MTIETMKIAIVHAINRSNYEINFITNKPNGLEIDIQKTNKYGYYNKYKTLLCNQKDLNEFKETIGVK